MKPEPINKRVWSVALYVIANLCCSNILVGYIVSSASKKHNQGAVEVDTAMFFALPAPVAAADVISMSVAVSLSVRVVFVSVFGSDDGGEEEDDDDDGDDELLVCVEDNIH